MIADIKSTGSCCKRAGKVYWPLFAIASSGLEGYRKRGRQNACPPSFRPTERTKVLENLVKTKKIPNLRHLPLTNPPKMRIL